MSENTYFSSPGAYPARRAAALSGVPLSTVHYWSRNGVLVPSVSAQRVKLWSYTDLLSLRTIYWLRQSKVENGREIASSSMPAVRRALAELAKLELGLCDSSYQPRIFVEPDGRVLVKDAGNRILDPNGQVVVDSLLDLFAPFPTSEGTLGPDLRSPRPQLRIAPAKLSGAPHIQATRLETQAVAALFNRGFEFDRLGELYPFVEHVALQQAVELEKQLQQNAAVAA